MPTGSNAWLDDIAVVRVDQSCSSPYDAFAFALPEQNLDWAVEPTRFSGYGRVRPGSSPVTFPLPLRTYVNESIRLMTTFEQFTILYMEMDSPQDLGTADEFASMMQNATANHLKCYRVTAITGSTYGGDSGGPLYLLPPTGPATLVGLSSSIYFQRSKPSNLLISCFADVRYYDSWIRGN